MLDLYTRAKQGSQILVYSKIVTSVFGFLTTIYILRNLSVKDYGIYSVLLAVLSYVIVLSSLGLPSIFQRYLPEFFEKNQSGLLKRLVEKGLLFRFGIGSLLIFVLLLMSRYIGILTHITNYPSYFAVFSIAIIFALEVELLSTTLTSIFRHRQFVISQILYTLIRAAVLVVLLYYGTGLFGLLIAEGTAYIGQFLLQMFFYRGYLKGHKTDSSIKLPAKRLIRFGSFSYFDEMGSWVLSVSTDMFVISAFLGPVAVGLYAFANRVMVMLSRLLPQDVFMEIVRPAFYVRYSQSGKHEDLVKMFNILTKLIAFIAFPLAVGIIVLGDKLILYVFDPKYIKTLPVLWIVAVFSALNAIDFPLGLLVRSIEKPEINFYSKVFAVYNLVLDLLVVRPFGIVGVAVATGSAILFKNLFILVQARKQIDLVVDWLSLIKIGLNSIVMGLLVYVIKSLAVSLVSFIVVAAFGVLVYLIAAYINKGFNDKERVILNRVLPKPVFIF